MRSEADRPSGSAAAERRRGETRWSLREGSGNHPGVEETCRLLGGLPQELSRQVYHLISCPRCLERMLALALEEEGAGDERAGEPAEGEALASSFNPLLARGQMELGRRFERDREAAPALFDEILASPAAARMGSIEADPPRFASPALAERLLEEAARRACGAPAEAEELARLALAVIERVPASRFGEGTLDRLRMMGWCRIGQARRLRDDARGAEEAFGAAGNAAEGVAVDGLERALHCRELALLRRDQGRVDEALGLLMRAAEVFHERGDPPRLAETLLERGWTLIDEDPRLALRALRSACELIPLEARPWPALRVRQALALSHACLGQRREAERRLAESRELAGRVEGRTAQMLAAWTDGEIAGQLGRTEEAVAVLRGAVEGLAAAGKPFDAALAAVDLIEVYAEAGRERDLGELRDEIERQLTPQLPPQTGVALAVALRVAGRAGVATPYLLAHTRQLLRRARGGAEPAYEPSRGAQLGVDWDQLPQSVRAGICTQVGAGEEAAGARACEVPQRARQVIAGAYQELTRTEIRWEGTGGE